MRIDLTYTCDDGYVVRLATLDETGVRADPRLTGEEGRAAMRDVLARLGVPYQEPDTVAGVC